MCRDKTSGSTNGLRIRIGWCVQPAIGLSVIQRLAMGSSLRGRPPDGCARSEHYSAGIHR
jgi:hypothetical protein